MKIHRVRSPFMSREGQFEAGSRTLVIGLDVYALENVDSFRCYLGNSTKCYYEIGTKDALLLADKYDSFWRNPKGKQVAILPLRDFKRVETEAPEIKVEVPEKKDNINLPLF